jgi:hypothetical protein
VCGNRLSAVQVKYVISATSVDPRPPRQSILARP